jgi:hypothetical protein
MFCDVGITALAERLDPEELQRPDARIESWRRSGVAIDTSLSIGDGLMAYWLADRTRRHAERGERPWISCRR